MSYEYYCTYCGQRLRQGALSMMKGDENATKPVLFDLQYLFTGNQPRDERSRFSTLKLYLTEQELRKEFWDRAASRTDPVKIEMSFSRVLQYLCGKNNLDDAAIKHLTLEDIREYAKQDDIRIPAARRTRSPGLRYGQTVEPEDKEEGEPVEQEKKENPVPDAIQALFRHFEGNKSDEAAASAVKDDLQMLQRCFRASEDGKDEKFCFEIQRVEEQAEDRSKVLTGYQFIRMDDRRKVRVENARVCPECKKQIFDHAGTARHQAVSFIGYQESGKTSTILALASYLSSQRLQGNNENAGAEGRIWQNAEPIRGTGVFELISPSLRLQEDLLLFGMGVAPIKNEATKRDDAYSATFRIQNAKGKYTILTLTDLPGELCFEDGTVDTDRILNTFPIALNCDVFVACFDTKKMNLLSIQRVCQWANRFQDLRAELQHQTAYVPTMLLFTKCEELERLAGGEGGTEPIPRRAVPEVAYSLEKEQAAIKANAAYRAVFDEFARYGELDSGYHASLRCSPYGYSAPKRTEVLPDFDRNWGNSNERKQWLDSFHEYNARLTAAEGQNNGDRLFPGGENTLLREVQIYREKLGRLKLVEGSLDLFFDANNAPHNSAVHVPSSQLPLAEGSRTVIAIKGTNRVPVNESGPSNRSIELTTPYGTLYYEFKRIEEITVNVKQSIHETLARYPAGLLLLYADDGDPTSGTSGHYTAVVYEQTKLYHEPKPKHIYELARWLLSVTGCIPAEAEYTPPGSAMSRRQYNLTRPQLRRQVPIEENRFEEALVRCALFENPGQYDEKFIKADYEYGWLKRRRLERYVKRYPDSNVESDR